jgi:hypothetical protein
MALPKPAAKIWIDYDKKKVMLSAPFNDNFNRLIHSLPRHFDKENKVWEFELEFVDQIIDIAMRVWSNVIRPPFLLIEIFEHLTEDDLKEMYENLVKRHKGDDKTLVDLLNRFFGDYIDLTELMRKKKRLIRLAPQERTYSPESEQDVRAVRADLDAVLENIRVRPRPGRPGPRIIEDEDENE